MDFKKPIPLLERIQTCYQENPQPFRVLMAGTFIDRLGTNLIMPFDARITIGTSSNPVDEEKRKYGSGTHHYLCL